MGSKPTADKFHVKSLLSSGRNATHDLYELLYFQVRRRTKNSATGTQTRVARVRAGYPNQLDYSGIGDWLERRTNNSRSTRFQPRHVRHVVS